jgi:hypothetical protein
VLAIFVLVVLTGMGTALLFMSQSEVRMSQAGLRVKEAFYLAEAGLEDGRMRLYNRNKGEPFTTELGLAAGSNGKLEFDPDKIQALYKGDTFAGFGGFGDDRPLANGALGDGWYIAFLTNDPDEPIPGRLNTTDSNDRVMITGVAAGPDRSFEVVQAIVEIRHIFPATPPATITIMGPDPFFEGGTSNAKKMIGEDCNGAGIPGLYAPVIGVIGSSGVADPCPGSGSVVCGIKKPATFTSGYGLYSGNGTAADVTDPTDPIVKDGVGPIDPAWDDCKVLQELAEDVRHAADVVCTQGVACTWPPDDPSRVIFIEGDWYVPPTDSGHGLLFATGELTMHGQTAWNGMIYVVGEGSFVRKGAGNGILSGAMFVADIAGPDNIYGTNDDCGGPDHGFDTGNYDQSGGGTGDEIYCTDDINPALPVHPYEILSFLQR